MTGVLSVDPRSDPRWSRLSLRPRANLFTSPPWLTAITETYGFEPLGRVLVDSSGAPVAGFTWIDVDDLRGRRRVALPFSERAGPIADDAEAWVAVSADALDGSRPFQLRCLGTSPAAGDPRLTTVGEQAWHETPLNREPAELHAALRPQTRRNIAKAARAGVEVELRTDIDAVADFYRLHVVLRKNKYRLLAQPWTFFEQLHRAFAPDDAIRTVLAMVGGRAVAAALYLTWGDTVYYKFGASLGEHLPLRPNDAIHWTVIKWAHGRRLRALDWGVSDLDQPGLVAYKRNWASTEGCVRTLRAGTMPSGRRTLAVQRALGALTDLLTRPAVPDRVTARAGDVLYRFFC